MDFGTGGHLCSTYFRIFELVFAFRVELALDRNESLLTKPYLIEYCFRVSIQLEIVKKVVK